MLQAGARDVRLAADDHLPDSLVGTDAVVIGDNDVKMYSLYKIKFNFIYKFISNLFYLISLIGKNPSSIISRKYLFFVNIKLTCIFSGVTS